MVRIRADRGEGGGLRNLEADEQKEVKAVLPRGCNVFFDGSGGSGQQQAVEECKCWLLCEVLFWVPVGVWACIKG